MTTLYANANRIRAEARQLDPVKVLITLLTLPFFLLGWTARMVWVVIALAWTGAVYGWRTATEQLDARQAAARTG